MTRRGESCHAMMAGTVTHSLNQTVIKYQRLMKHETLFLSHLYPRLLVTNSLYLFSPELWHHTLVRTQDRPGPGAWGYPGYVIREIFWYIILAGVSTLQDSGHPGPGDRGRTKKLLARAYKRGVMRVNKKAIIDLWLQKMCVRFVANLWEGEGKKISFIIYQHMTFGQT